MIVPRRYHVNVVHYRLTAGNFRSFDNNH